MTIGILFFAVCAGWMSFSLTFHEATELLDEELQQVADLLVRNHISIPSDTASPDSENFKIKKAIIVQNLSGSNGPPPLLHFPKDLPDGIQTVNAGGYTWRVLVTKSLSGERFAIAQRLFLRNKIAREGTIATLLSFLMFAGVAVVGACLLVKYIFRPMNFFANSIDKRDDQDLSPLSEHDVPLELLPFIEALNRMFKRVAGSMEMQRRFVDNAAHELRSPLTALTLQAERLEAASMSPEAQERLAQLRGGLSRASNLLNQLLTLARTQGQQKEGPETVSLNQLFKQLCEDVIPLADSRDIDLGVISHDEITLRIPPTALNIIMKNLVDNAVRYTPEGGRVDLYAGYENGQVVLVVTDTGPGIPVQEQERVYLPFYRVLGNAAPGSGLGLSIVKTLVDSLGGNIAMTNLNTDGKAGFQVTVHLPA